MADRSIKLRELRRILIRYEVGEDTSRGKGSHTTFFKKMARGTVTYPVPTSPRDVLVCYVRGCRQRFGLRVVDGVSDEEFYGA